MNGWRAVPEQLGGTSSLSVLDVTWVSLSPSPWSLAQGFSCVPPGQGGNARQPAGHRGGLQSAQGWF